ncbi:MAG: sigma 54-interacting transcriptional regulator [Acidobacteria bacterium]|nr:sigma 54-interacting transcriptional regulator [Acidobacteriota bacterium]
MKPRLLGVAGPLAGGSWPLGPGAVTLGRHGDSGLHVPDLGVSRQHCTISPEEGRWVLRDLDSRHGTFVNGLPVHERALLPGDRVQIGGSLFLFASDDPAGKEADKRLIDAADYAAESTIHWSLDAPPLAPEALLATLSPGAERAQHDLGALLEASEELGALAGAEPLARRLLDLVFAVAPAARAALLLLDARGEPETAFALDRQGRTEAFPLSRTLLHKTVGERAALLAVDVLRTPGLGDAESVQAERLQSLIALPLAGPEGVLGLLYADSREPGARFDEGHLALLAAACRFTALALGNLRRMEWLQAEARRLDDARDLALVGESPRMKEVYRLLARVAPTGSTVLLLGESGTGKELAARALHDASPRAGRPFVAINCATLLETLLESELFGHEKGAFTGAVERKAGKLEVADTGTVFLDEVGEIHPALQAKLLRFLEQREFERVGGTRPIRVDVRVIAATHRDLEAAIQAGSFRADLYYRLGVITLTLPPLRERFEDVPLLASHFAARLSRDLGRRVAGFSPEARACLLRYPWPGNVRELRNAVERALVLCEGELIVPADLPEAVLEAAAGTAREPAAAIPRFHAAVNEYKRRLILDAVKESGGSIARAATLLGLHSNYLHRLVTNLELRGALQEL